MSDTHLISQDCSRRILICARDYCTSGIIRLQPGRYRFQVRYFILERPGSRKANRLADASLVRRLLQKETEPTPAQMRAERKDREDFIEIMAADWKSGVVFNGIHLGRNLQYCSEHKPLFAQLDTTLKASADLELRFTLLDDCRVEVVEMKILRRKVLLPDNPKILFIVEDRPDPTFCPHQGVSMLAGYLSERGITAHALITSMTDDVEIERALEKYRYDYVGFTVLTGMEPLIVARAKRIKEILRNTLIVVGGPHVTITRDQIMRHNPVIDVAVVGEGEETLYQLLSGRSPASVAGAICRQGAQVMANGPRAPFKDLASLPQARLDVYHSDEWQAYSILTSRGCPFKCDFCSASRLWGSTIRFRPPIQIEQQLRWIYEHGSHGTLVKINDDMFNLSKKRVIAILSILREFPFSYFACGLRADRIDSEIAQAMKRAGISGCGVGIESADNTSLKLMNKSETIEEIEAGIIHLQDQGIHVCGQFIVGNRGDTLASVQKSIDFARRLKMHSARFYAAVLYPGTPLTEFVHKNRYKLAKPVWATADSPSTGVYFETPEFPLAHRVEALRRADKAGFINRFPSSETVSSAGPANPTSTIIQG